MESRELGELIPGLPEELGRECVTRLPYTSYRVASGVCRRWRQLFPSRDFYNHRRANSRTLKVACFVQALPPNHHHDEDASSFDNNNNNNNNKKKASPRYGITVFDPVGRTWDRVDPPPKYPEGLPMFCQVAGCQGKLVVMGGWDPVSYEPSTQVLVYEFASGRWKRGKDMPEKMSFFAIGSSSGGRVYVAGGHDEGKNAMGTAWVYDLRTDEWTQLPPMSRGRDECEGFVVAGGEDGQEEEEEFWVVGGYGTEEQGAFKGDAEVYEARTGRWRRVEEAWVEGRSPRGCVGGGGRKEKMVDWGELVGVGMGVSGVEVGERAVVVVMTGSECHQGFYLKEGGHNGNDHSKLERIEGIPEGFSGFVQSACSVEI